MDLLTTTQIDLFMCLMLLLTLLVAYFKLDRCRAGHGLLVAIIIVIMGLLALEVTSVAIDSRFNPEVAAHDWLVPWARLVNSLGFALVPVPGLLLWFFVHRWTGTAMQGWAIAIGAFPVICNIILSLLSFNGGILFEIAPDNRYSRGPGFALSPLAFYCGQMLTVFFIFRQFRELKREETILLAVTAALPMLIGAIQLVHATILTIWSSWAISTVILFVGVMVCNAETDELTRLDNRTAFRNAIHVARTMNPLRLCVAMIDMDGLKAINDRYGHHAGDDAIRTLAATMRLVFDRKTRLMRLGGDEFAVLEFSDDPAAIYEKLCNVEERLAQHNAISGKPYRVAFSYGLACSREGEHLDDLLKRCDNLMYERKRNKYRKA